MNTLQSHFDEYDSGIVSEQGFCALSDAEGYGAASSIGACSTCVARLWQALESGQILKLFCPGGKAFSVRTEMELKDWCNKYLPDSYSEFVRRGQR